MQRITFHIICLLALLGISLPAIAQTDTLCVNATTNNYFVTNTSGSSYFWEPQGGGVINSGQGSSLVNITWPQVVGTYSLTVTETSIDGCVGQPQQLIIEVVPTYSDTFTITVCDADLPYSWNGNSYNSGGIYTVNYTSTSGCDSSQTLILNVTPVVSPQLSCGISSTSSVTVNWVAVVGATSYQLDYLVNGVLVGSGIDVITTTYEVTGLNPSDAVSFTILPIGGSDNCFTAASFTCTSDGCVPPIFSSQPLPLAVCANESATIIANVTGFSSLQWQMSVDGGLSFTTLSDNAIFSGSTTETLSIADVSGLDGAIFQLVASESTNTCPVTSSSAELTVNLLPSVVFTAPDLVSPPDTHITCTSPSTSIVAGGGTTYTWSGGQSPNTALNTFITPGLYTVEVENVFGCVVTEQINISGDFQTFASQIDTAICSGNSYTLPDGNSVSVAGIYPVILDAENGCDSVVTVNLTFTPSLSGTFTNTACSGSGYSVVIGGTTYDEANPSGTETLVSSTGCDSVVTINLTFTPSLSGTFTNTACSGSGYSVVIGGTTYNEANPSGTETLVSSTGCDSVVTINLTFTPNLTASEDVSICDAQLPYSWNGNSYNAAGTYTVTLQNAANCDSVVTLNLTVSPSLTANENIAICDAQLPYTWNGNSYNAAGTYTVTLQNVANCDSVVTLNLSVNPTLTASEDVSICDAQLPYSWNGNSYNAAGSYSVTLSTASGCDSVVTLNLTVSPSLTASEDISICDAQLPY
ncbi:MAG: hypothetical protein ACK5B6_00225, partial [Bacteroidia bacterium]